MPEDDVDSVEEVAGMELEVSDARLISRFQIGDDQQIPENRSDAFLAVRFRAETVADSPVSHPSPSQIVAVTGNQQSEPVRAQGQLSQPVTGPLYASTDAARTGVASTGWLIYEVPSDTASATISWSDPIDDVEASWEVTLAPGDLPNVNITSFTGPESVERYQDISLSLVAENAGGSSTTVDAEVRSDALDGAIPVTLDVPSGETVDESIPVPYPPDGDIGTTFRLVDEYGEIVSTTTVNYEIPVRSFGESFQTPSGSTVTISDLRFVDTIEYSSQYTNPDEANEGETFAVVNVSVDTGDSGMGTIPTNDALSAEVDGESYSHYQLYVSALSQPSGPTYNQQFESLNPNISLSGSVIFEVPETEPDSVSIRWEEAQNYGEETTVTARWS